MINPINPVINLDFPWFMWQFNQELNTQYYIFINNGLTHFKDTLGTIEGITTFIIEN